MTQPSEFDRAAREGRRQLITAELIGEGRLRSLYWTDAEFKASVELLVNLMINAVEGMAAEAKVRQQLRHYVMARLDSVKITDVSVT